MQKDEQVFRVRLRCYGGCCLGQLACLYRRMQKPETTERKLLHLQ